MLSVTWQMYHTNALYFSSFEFSVADVSFNEYVIYELYTKRSQDNDNKAISCFMTLLQYTSFSEVTTQRAYLIVQYWFYIIYIRDLGNTFNLIKFWRENKSLDLITSTTSKLHVKINSLCNLNINIDVCMKEKYDSKF